MAVDDWPEWLPANWMIQIVRINKRKVKVYQDPITGKKFFSKPQVMNHLGNTESSTAICVTPLNSCPVSTLGAEKPQSPKEATEVQKNETTGTTESTCKSPDYKVISRIPAEGLPPGWIKEIGVRPHGSIKKKDSYYLDLLTGYVFFSKLDALRYLDSGDIKKCAVRPLRRDMNQEDQTVQEERRIEDEYLDVGSAGESEFDDGSRKGKRKFKGDIEGLPGTQKMKKSSAGSKYDALLEASMLARKERDLAKAEQDKAKYDDVRSPLVEEYSIGDCMTTLEATSGVSSRSYTKALSFFPDINWRKMFLMMSENRRKEWLESLDE